MINTRPYCKYPPRQIKNEHYVDNLNAACSLLIFVTAATATLGYIYLIVFIILVQYLSLAFFILLKNLYFYLIYASIFFTKWVMFSLLFLRQFFLFFLLFLCLFFFVHYFRSLDFWRITVFDFFCGDIGLKICQYSSLIFCFVFLLS